MIRLLVSTFLVPVLVLLHTQCVPAGAVESHSDNEHKINVVFRVARSSEGNVTGKFPKATKKLPS